MKNRYAQSYRTKPTMYKRAPFKKSRTSHSVAQMRHHASGVEDLVARKSSTTTLEDRDQRVDELADGVGAGGAVVEDVGTVCGGAGADAGVCGGAPVTSTPMHSESGSLMPISSPLAGKMCVPNSVLAAGISSLMSVNFWAGDDRMVPAAAEVGAAGEVIQLVAGRSVSRGHSGSRRELFERADAGDDLVDNCLDEVPEGRRNEPDAICVGCAPSKLRTTMLGMQMPPLEWKWTVDGHEALN